MTRERNPRPMLASAAVAALFLVASVFVAIAADAPEDHAVVGRWSITSDAGGGVWAFQPGGAVFVTGPGGISSEGTWSAADGEAEFDAAVEYQGAGQLLVVQGQVSPDLVSVAVHVTASEAERPEDADPWPAESRLVGQRFGVAVEETPLPSEPPADCLRPEWVDGQVDWDRCDEGITPA